MLKTINAFLKDLEIKGRSPNTIYNYKLQLRTFYSWCQQTETDFIRLRPIQAKHYRDALYSAGMSGKTINTMIGTLRTFYEYLMEEELIPGNPILKNLRVREKPRFPTPLTDEEKPIILSILEEKEVHIKLAFKTMLAAGLRVGEAASLTKKDIRIEDHRMVLFIKNAKGGKPRKVPVVDPVTAQELYEYIKDVPEGEPIFRVSKRTLQDHARRIKKRTGIHFYVHRLRHTFATELLAKDTRLDVIQRVMGHADISTTRKYAETLNQDILNIAEPMNSGKKDRE
ncbi:MAG: tyrosine-type recombinase/integrase [Clostridiales bacterium]|nr:tyrosine-type recombinase/integrase [Clostridiales bacterium]